MFRDGLSMVIDMAMPGATRIQADCVDTALAGEPIEPDLVLLDIRLKGGSGLEGIARIRRRWPDTPVLMLSSQDEPETQRLALARGAAAFVSKGETAEKIIEIIRQLLRGDYAKSAPVGNAPARQLTPRQREVLELLHQGLSNKLVARKLALSENTVRRHVQDILEYFQVVSRAEAVFAARRDGLIG